MSADKDEYSGYLFDFDEPERAELINRRIHDGTSFTDTLSDSDWSLQKREIFLLTFDERLSAIALVTSGHAVATDKRLIRFERFVPIKDAIFLPELENEISRDLRSFVARASSGSGRRLIGMWAEVLDAVKILRPYLEDDLNRLLAEREQSEPDTDQPGYRTMIEQKDAVNVAMRIAGFDHKLLSRAPLPFEHPTPFLDILDSLTQREDKLNENADSIPQREDKMVEHDAHVPFFDDLKLSHRERSGRTFFTNGRERLYIMDVNRHPIEEALGVDLLYYSYRFCSFVMVQYKRLACEAGGWKYRPSSDDNFRNELERMIRCQSLLNSQSDAPEALQNFRLYPDPFHFKFCWSEVDEPTSTEMIPGIYVPLKYLIQFKDSDMAIGPRKGVYIGEDNIGRNYSNSLFIELVRNGWVGSCGVASDVLEKIVQISNEKDRSLIFAEHTQTGSFEK
jgi:hypothetical protein